MLSAISLSEFGMKNNAGGPFGAVIVKDGKIIGKGYNQVTSTNDPTAHAEVVAIRDACRNLSTFELVNCEIYTSCEPCPMCLSSIYWARIEKIYYANTRKDAASIGFDDDLIYNEIPKKVDERLIPSARIMGADAFKVFEQWNHKSDKIEY